MASVDGRYSLQESSDESFQFECSPCEYEGIKTEAKHFCPDCGDYLCQSCKMTHQKLSVTRKHQVVSGSKMPKKGETSKEPQFPTLALCSCNSKEVTVYCEDHNEVICVNCKILKHRSCNSVEIEVKCNDIESTTTESTHQSMIELKEKLDTLQKKRNEDMQDLASQEDRSRETVKAFRRELNEQLDKMEEQSLADIDKYAEEQRKTIQQHIDTCTAAINKLESDNNPFQAARATSEKRLIFIHNLQLSKTMEQVKTVIEEINEEVYKPDVSFECDQSLKLTGTLSIGKVKTAQMQETRKVIVDMNITSSRQVDVKVPTDKNNPLICGSAFMPTGVLVLCDQSNSALKLLKVDLTLKEHITLPSDPWDMSVMSKDEVVITLPNIKSLLFIKVYPTLQRGSSVQLDQRCQGVAVHDGLIYVSFHNGEIRVLDRSGQQQKNMYSTFRFNLPYYIDITHSGMLCVSENTSHTIRGFLNGSEVYKYTDSGLRGPLGVYIDGALNVLTCGGSSINCHMIDKNGKQVKVLLSISDGLQSPYTLSFRQRDKTLVVGGYQMKLLVFEMA